MRHVQVRQVGATAAQQSSEKVLELRVRRGYIQVLQYVRLGQEIVKIVDVVL